MGKGGREGAHLRVKEDPEPKHSRWNQVSHRTPIIRNTVECIFPRLSCAQDSRSANAVSQFDYASLRDFMMMAYAEYICSFRAALKTCLSLSGPSSAPWTAAQDYRYPGPWPPTPVSRAVARAGD